MPVHVTARIERGTTKDTMELVIPPDVVDALGAGRRPPVTVTIGAYTYRSTIATMGGQFMVGIAAEHRRHLQLDGIDEVEVTLAVDASPRDTPLPADLEAALRDAGVLDTFRALAPSHRKEHVRAVEEAKAPATREPHRQVVQSVSGRGMGGAETREPSGNETRVGSRGERGTGSRPRRWLPGAPGTHAQVSTRLALTPRPASSGRAWSHPCPAHSETATRSLAAGRSATAGASAAVAPFPKTAIRCGLPRSGGGR
jgi:hypothetical protein